MWWFLLVFVFVLLIRFAWKAYKDPAHQLGIEAANLGWRATGTVTDSNGYRNTLLIREGYQAVILYKEKRVQLLVPSINETFKDFQSIEKRLIDLEIDADKDNDEHSVDIHPPLDDANALVVQYLKNNNWGNGDLVKLGIASELFVYATTFVAMKESGYPLNDFEWNTFQHAMENRMLAIKDDGSVRSGVEHNSDGSYAFVQYASNYSKRFSTIDFVGARIPNEVSRKAVVKQVQIALEINPNELPDFQDFFKEITKRVSETVFPRLCKLFR